MAAYAAASSLQGAEHRLGVALDLAWTRNAAASRRSNALALPIPLSDQWCKAPRTTAPGGSDWARSQSVFPKTILLATLLLSKPNAFLEENPSDRNPSDRRINGRADENPYDSCFCIF